MSFFAFPLACLICLIPRKTEAKIRRRLLAILSLVLTFGLISCGGGLQGNGGGSGSPGTPAGTYTITVTATCGSVTHTARVSLTVNP